MHKKKRLYTTSFLIVLLALLGISVFFYFNFTTVVVNGESMLPTFRNGDRLLACKAYWLVGGIHKKDVVVIKNPDGKPDEYVIKRVLGLPGDEIDFQNVPGDWRIANGVYHVPDGHVYVIGDNREVSDDSRKFGPVPLENVIGKIVIWR